MTIKIRLFSLPALLITAVGFGASGVAPALAEDAFATWGSVDNQALSQERGKAFETDEAALAAAAGVQHQVVTFNGVPQQGVPGDVNLGTSTFAGQVLSTNVINSGNNSVFQTQSVIAVTVVESTLSQ